MAFSNFPNPFFGSDLAGAQCSIGTPPGLLGNQADPGHHHSIPDPGHCHSVYEAYPIQRLAPAQGADVFGLAEMERRQQEMQKAQALYEMDRLRHAKDRLPHGATVNDLARWLEENPTAPPCYQPISQPAPNKVLLLLE